MAWCIDILLCKFYITIVFCFVFMTSVNQQTYCILLWLSPYPWVVPVNGYIEINTWMNEWESEWVSKWISEWVNEWVSEWVSE